MILITLMIRFLHFNLTSASTNKEVNDSSCASDSASAALFSSATSVYSGINSNVHNDPNPFQLFAKSDEKTPTKQGNHSLVSVQSQALMTTQDDGCCYIDEEYDISSRARCSTSHDAGESTSFCTHNVPTIPSVNVSEPKSCTAPAIDESRPEMTSEVGHDNKADHSFSTNQDQHDEELTSSAVSSHRLLKVRNTPCQQGLYILSEVTHEGEDTLIEACRDSWQQESLQLEDELSQNFVNGWVRFRKQLLPRAQKNHLNLYTPRATLIEKSSISEKTNKTPCFDSAQRDHYDFRLSFSTQSGVDTCNMTSPTNMGATFSQTTTDQNDSENGEVGYSDDDVEEDDDNQRILSQGGASGWRDYRPFTPDFDGNSSEHEYDTIVDRNRTNSGSLLRERSSFKRIGRHRSLSIDSV